MARAKKPRRVPKPAKTAATPVARARAAWRDPSKRRRLATIALLGTVVVLFALLFDWTWLRGPIERRVSAATGREFRILGGLDVDFFPLSVHAGGFRLGNASWSKDPLMASAADVTVGVRFWPLLRGDVELSTVRAHRLELLLERTAKGEPNWHLGNGNEKRVPPEVDNLALDEGRIEIRDPRDRTDLALDVHSAPRGARDARAPLLLQGSGRFRGERFTLDGRVDSPLALRDKDRPYHIDLTAASGGTHAHASGAVAVPVPLRRFDLQFELSGATLEALYPLFGLALPDTPPYRLEGRLVRSGTRFAYEDFKGRIGDSDMAGTAVFDTGGERPMLKGDFVSQHLDLDDLAGLIGAPPRTGPDETASPAQVRASAQLKASPRILPQKPYDRAKFRAMDLDATLRAVQVDAKPLPIERMTLKIAIDDGLVLIDPLELGAAGGRVVGAVRLDARPNPIATHAKFTLSGLRFPKLFPNVDLAKTSAGNLGGEIEFNGKGNSVAQMLATADGKLGIVMGRGRISNLLIEVAGLDLAEILKFKLGKDRIIPIRCAYADFAIDDGIASASKLAFDTTDTVIYGEGSASLRDESYDLTIHPEPKDKSPLSLRTPLKVAGTFKDPSVSPSKGPLALRTVGAAVLYSLAPPAALIALLETGPGEDTDCGGAAAVEAETRVIAAQRGR